MNILFLDAYFEPETIAYTHLERDILDALSIQGHRVDVICPIPTRGIKHDVAKKYRKTRHEILYNGQVHVRRFWAPQEGKNPIVRAFRYFWCNLRTYQLARKYLNIDAVFSNSTPPTQGMLSAIVAKRCGRIKKKKIPFIYNLQDIFPDSLVNTQMTRERSFVWKIGRAIENYTYRNSDTIVTISEGFKKNIRNKGVPEEKIRVISNWIDLETVFPVPREKNTIITEFDISSEKFIVVYAGNFGASQGADIILKVAELLQKYLEIEFVIFGAGPYFQEAKEKASCMENVKIFDLQPQERISEVYSLGDVALITCKHGTGRAGLPSKIWSIMACNTSIIASFDMDSDLADVISRSQAGCCVEPGNVDALKEAVLKKYVQWESGSSDMLTTREYAKKHVSKDVCVDEFVKILCGANGSR